MSLRATITPLIAAKAVAASRVNSPPSIRNESGRRLFGGDLANGLAGDLESLSQAINSLQSAAKIPQSLLQILLTDPTSGTVVAAFGAFAYQGVYYNNYLSEIHVGDPLGKHNPAEALFNANADGSVSIGQNGWLDIHDPFDGNAAWIGTQFDTLAITNAADNGAGLIRLTVAAHTLITGNTAQVRNMNLYGVPNADGMWTVTRIDANRFDLQGSTWAGAYLAPSAPAGIQTQTPTVDRVLQVTGAANNGAGLIRLTVAAHAYETGDKVNIAGVGGVPNATGQWIVTFIDANNFDLKLSTWGASAYTTGGTSLRYFAGMLAQTFAIGDSFPNYKLRAFADGSLRIKNATISLVSANGSIVLDPTIPSIVVTKTAGGSVTIDGSVPSIAFVSAAGTVTIDASNASIVVRNAAAATVASFQNGSTPELLGVHVTGAATVTGALASGNATVTGTLNVSSTAATGTLTVTGNITASGTLGVTGSLGGGEVDLIGKAAAPTAPGAGFAFLYYDTVIGALRYNLAGAGWVNIANAVGGADTQVLFNNVGVESGSADLTWNNGASILTAKFLSTQAITVTVNGMDITGVVLMRNVPKFAGTNSTAGGIALLGANCPAVTVGAPYTWLSVTSADGSAVYIPAWK